jgi:hypothetical protein
VERELTAPVDIAHPDGRLRREAVGWARHPIHRCNLPRGLPRVHAWNYWCVTSTEGALSLLVADVGFAGFALVSFLDYAAGAPVECVYVRPAGLRDQMPPGPRGNVVVDARRLHLSMCDVGEELRIVGAARTLLGTRIAIDLSVERPLAHETLNVLVPFDDERFQFTSKQQGLPARGSVRVGARAYHFGEDTESFACLDFGRGRWPRRIHWNWAFASCRRDGRTLGFNLGGKWTDGTGVTENGVVLDGRLHKVAEPVDFDYDARAYRDPWRIHTREGGRVELRFVPMRERAVRIPLGLVSVDLHQMMGWFSGVLVDDAGERVAVDRVLGLAETFRGRW